MTRRILGVLLLTFSLVMAVAAPAVAKMPPYEAEVSVDEDVATVTVVFDGYDMEVPTLEGVLALVQQDPPSDSASFIWIDLRRTEAFTYEGTVVIPYPGEWAIVAFPDASPPPPAEMYPTITFTASFAVAESQSTEATAETPDPAVTEIEVAAPKATVSESVNLSERDPIRATSEANRGQAIWIGTGAGAVLLTGAWALQRRRRSSPTL